MKRRQSYILFLTFFFLLVASCSKTDYQNSDNNNSENSDENDGNEDTDDTDDEDLSPQYTLNYKDADNIYINVKIAIDKYSWDLKGEQFFIENLDEQWEKINARFNACDKNDELKYEYIFEPDLQDIIVYEGNSYTPTSSVDVEVVKHLDRKIFNVVVIYDFCYDEGENQFLAFCGAVGDITAIACGWFDSNKKGQFNNTFDDNNVHCGITHELGHYRGLVDLYSSALSAENNEVNGEQFTPQSCIMNDVCYNDISTAFWSNYATNLMNQVSDDYHAYIDQLLYDGFAESFTINVTKNGAAADATINCYSMSPYANKLTTEAKHSFLVDNGQVVKDARKLYFDNPAYPWARASLMLLEARLADGTKKYHWLVDYDIHTKSMNGVKNIEINFKF